MAEGTETPGDRPGSEGERDILAERRARRAGEPLDPLLTRRADMAEQAVRTLEAHVTSLKLRLHEAEEERRRAADQLADREHELRRLTQREYAEQQLRAEAEERAERVERELRGQVELLEHRAAASERQARDLAASLERIRSELAAAQQTVAAERGELARGELQLGDRKHALVERERVLIDREQTLQGREQSVEERELALQAKLVELESRLQLERANELRVRAEREQPEPVRAELEQRHARLETRVADLELRVGDARRELEHERDARARSERQLELMREGHLQVQQLIGDLRELARELRDTASSAAPIEAGLSEARAAGPLQAAALATEPILAPTPAAAPPPPAGPVTAEEQQRREEMADALAAAVARLRARVAAASERVEEGTVEEAQVASTGEAQELPAEEAGSAAPEQAQASPAEQEQARPAEQVAAAPEWAIGRLQRAEPAAAAAPEGPELVQSVPRTARPPARGHSWLAPAIRRISERRNPQLAAELVVELLAAQHLVVKGPLTYGIRIAELGDFQVRVADGRVTVERIPERWRFGQVEFLLEGDAAAFAELAGGGAGRRLRGFRVQGRKRLARRVLAASRAPLTLAAIATADIRVWPGLILLALAEAIDPAWTRGHSFTLTFAIEGSESAMLYVELRDGRPLVVARGRGEQPRAIVHAGELALLRLFAGVPLRGDEQLLVEGDPTALELFVALSDRAQRLRAG
jgi:chaperonin cofactor prefoldin